VFGFEKTDIGSLTQLSRESRPRSVLRNLIFLGLVRVAETNLTAWVAGVGLPQQSENIAVGLRGQVATTFSPLSQAFPAT
jgi:hypothetical protein